MRLGIVFGCQTCYGFEGPMKVVSAQPRVCRQFLERGSFLRCLDQTTGLGDFLGVVFRERRLTRLAPFAWPETGFFSVFAGLVVSHILRPRQAGRARRSAIHSRALDRVIEFAVGGRIMVHDRSPAWIVLRCVCALF